MRRPEPTAREVAELPVGKHRVARNLKLHYLPPARSWVMHFFSPIYQRQVELGLGPYPLISLPEALRVVKEHQLAIFHGRCPLHEKREKKAARQQVVTFGEVAGHYLTAHQASWRNAEHRRQWDQAFKAHAKAVWDLPVAQVDTGMVMRVIEPLWHEQTQTAARLRGRIETVLAYATARHWRTGENPARWRGHLDQLLPSPKKLKPVEHLAALDWRELPSLWAELTRRSDLPALAIQFVLATAARRDEARLARWEEIDLLTKVWTIPAARTKSGTEHRVPLSDAALDVLQALIAIRRDGFLFPGANHGRPIGPTAMREVLGALRPGVTLHGTARSGFADWATHSGIALDLREAALAHQIEDKTRRAYQRQDLLEARRPVMARWSRFLSTPSKAGHKVVPIREEVAAARA